EQPPLNFFRAQRLRERLLFRRVGPCASQLVEQTPRARAVTGLERPGGIIGAGITPVESHQKINIKFVVFLSDCKVRDAEALDVASHFRRFGACRSERLNNLNQGLDLVERFLQLVFTTRQYRKAESRVNLANAVARRL